ncbi:hypothetical protein [Natronococcus wangiae]|uniref:hypothetical protein n=1 Tax=Natronococcus wangiae TaxID=3068275 RepID=UPI00273DE5B7|nr:hypothetical protein [Natronococcus sp. AD5]
MSKSQSSFSDFEGPTIHPPEDPTYAEGDLAFVLDGELHAEYDGDVICGHAIDPSKELLFKTREVNSAADLCLSCLENTDVQEYLVVYEACGSVSDHPVGYDVHLALRSDSDRHRLVSGFEDYVVPDESQEELEEEIEESTEEEAEWREDQKDRLLGHVQE